MTDYNAFQHDGFCGLVNSGFNARNGGCVSTDRVIARRGAVVGAAISLMDRGLGIVSATWPAPTYVNNPYIADFDGQDRVWSSHGDGTVVCSSRDLAAKLYTSPVPAAGTFYGVGCCDKAGACYTNHDPGITPGDFDHQVVKFKDDLTGIAWTTPNMPATRGNTVRMWYVEGVIYDTMLDTVTGVYSVRQLDAATGAVNWTVGDVLCRSPVPGGGFLGPDFSATPTVLRFYGKDGVATGVTLPDMVQEAYVTRQGITYADVPFNRVRAYDIAGVQILERTPPEMFNDPASTWTVNRLMVDDCNVPGGGAATIFCTGQLTRPASGLDPYATWTMGHLGGAQVAARTTATGTVMRINGHWATHT